MLELLEKYSEDKETIFLTDFIIQNKSEIILNCFNQGLLEPNEIRKNISETFDESSKQLNSVSTSNMLSRNI
jgi:hypothetical protein